MKRLIWMGCLSYLLIGLAHVVIGSLLTVMLDYYNRDYSDGGQLIFAQFSGFLIGVLSTPWWSKILGRRGALLLAFGCLCASQAVYSFLPPWQWLLVVAPVAGFGFGMIEAVVGALVIDAVEEKKAVAMSRLEVFFGVGALLMPLAASLFILAGWWQASFITLSLCALAMAAGWRWMSFDGVENQLGRVVQSGGTAVPSITYQPSQRGVITLFVIIFLLYVGLEMSLVNFLPSILIENASVSDAIGTLSVTFYWSTMVLGRTFSGVIAEKIRYAQYLLISSLGTLVVLVLFSIVTNLWVALFLVLLLGLFMAGIFGIGLIYANYLLPGMTERTTSMLIAAGGIGGALLPLFTGWGMDHYTVGTTLWLLVGIAFAMTLLLIWAARLKASFMKAA